MQRRMLAPSVVLTIAMLPACGGGVTHTENPPPPDPEPRMTENPPAPDPDPGLNANPPPPDPEIATDPEGEETSETPDGTDGETAALPPGVHRNDKGECFKMVEVNCPPPDVATCNPPPPMKVDCETGEPE